MKNLNLHTPFKKLLLCLLALGFLLSVRQEIFAQSADRSCLAPVSSWQKHSDDLAAFQELLEKLGIRDDINGNTIFGMPIVEWVKDHQLYYEYPESPNPFEERDANILANNIQRSNSVPRIRGLLLAFYKTIGREDEGKRIINGRNGKAQLWHLVLWMARNQTVTQVREKREGKLFATIDVRTMKLKDLPIWPQNSHGSVAEDLVTWMSVKGKAPPLDYYRKRKISMAQIESETSPKWVVPGGEKASRQTTVGPSNPVSEAL